jgi:putative oxidoreductase
MDVMNSKQSLDSGLLVLRVAVGSVFLAHGLQKVFVFGFAGLTGFLESAGLPFPALNAAVLMVVEVGGGLALLAGASTRLAAFLLAGAMAVATVVVHLPNGYFLPNGVEFALTMMLTSLALLLTGPGRYSVDAARMGPAQASVTPHLRKAA